MPDYVRTIRAKIGHDMLMLVGAGIIIYRYGQVLLQHRTDNGMWGYAGGSVEVGEAVEDAARRELFEETGLTANAVEFFGVYSGADQQYTYPNGDRVSIVDIVYICSDFSGELRCDGDESTELRWFALDELPEISPPCRRILADFSAQVK